MTAAGSTPQAGWYPNPRGPGRRYWDGTRWTERTQDDEAPAPVIAAVPAAPPAPAAPAQPPTPSAPGAPGTPMVVVTGEAKFTHPRSKVFFTFGLYWWFWHYAIACGLRDDFDVDIDPGRELLLCLIPFYGALVWWRFLKLIRSTQRSLGMQQVLSPVRAFWLSSMWFAAVPYVSRHVNALYMVRHGQLVERSRR